MSSHLLTLLQQAISHHQQGRLQQAEDVYVQVLQINPRQFDALHLIGVIAKQRGDTQSALNFFAKAIAVDARQSKVHCNLGATFQEIGEYAKALTCYDLALSLQNDYALAWNNRGNTLRELKRYQEALDSFTSAIELQLNYPEAFLNRGICLQELGEHAQAMADFEDAIKLRGAYPAAQFARGFSLQQLGHYEEALDAYTLALQSQTAPTVADLAALHCNRGMVFAKLQRYSEALIDLQQAQALRPDFANAYLQAAHVYRSLQEDEAAILAYQTALALTHDKAQQAQIEYCLASLGATPAPSAAPAMYVKELFDQYAEHFDAHLQTLSYQVPRLLQDALQSSGLNHLTKIERALDLGCGTGLCGDYLASVAQHLTGVDLSQNMLDKARARDVYQALICDDILHFLAQASVNYDVIMAADVLVYFGQLEELFTAVKDKLASGGCFAFSVEASAMDEIYLQASQRYAHSANYIRQLAEKHGLQLRHSSQHSGRREAQQEVQSLIVVLQKN
jgi:predicted TPR repeat methyltransferase